MTVQAWETHWQPGKHRRLLTALLALAILVPLGVLFFDHNRHLSEHKAMAATERDGIQYLLVLSQLTIALTDAQSAAVSGEPVPQEALDRAVADVTEVDDQVGDELQVSERWSQLRNTIERAAVTNHADGAAAYASYEEATSLLLSLHNRLRDTTGLVRDPDQDAYHLQDAAGGTLPETVVALGRLVDQVAIAASGSAGDQAAHAPEVSAAVAAATTPADDFVAGIQAALDTTEVRSLSSTVLGMYDRFLRAKDAVLGIVPADGQTGDVDLGMLAGMHTQVQAAADELSTALLTELDTMIEARESALARSQWIAFASLAAGVLLAAGLVAVTLVRHLRRPRLRPHQSELSGGSGDDGRGSGSGSGNSTPELPLVRRSISDAAAGYEPRSGTPATGARLAGEVLGSERSDAR